MKKIVLLLSLTLIFGVSSFAVQRDTVKVLAIGNSFSEESVINLTDSSASDIAWASVGQYTTLMNPYHALTIAGAIANNGTAKLPFVVKNFASPSGRVVKEVTAEEVVYTTPENAKKLKELMRGAVKNNYGDWNFSGVTMCGKTGTAEVSDTEKPHSWFLGFSEDEIIPEKYEHEITVSIAYINGEFYNVPEITIDKILPDIANLCFIGFEAINHKADMLGFQLHQSAFDCLDRLIIACNADQLWPGADSFDDQLQNSIEQIMFKRILGQQNVKFQLFSEILKIVFP